jgi:CHAT domain-containing protein
VLCDASASEEGLRRALPAERRWRAVHFACHGLVNPRQPLLSALALTPSPSDDGYLTALEVFSLRIPADLVVLSACESARGTVVRGEGLSGLVRAFMVAGSPRVLASLWKVGDEATAEFMRRFYASWLAGQGAAAALRSAQADLRAHPRWGAPRHWAAWVLWGLPR